MAEGTAPTTTTETTTTPATAVTTPAAVVEPIPRWDSKTYWINGLMVIAALATTAYYLWKNGGAITPESFTAMFAAVWSAIQIVLRETTTAPLQGMFNKKVGLLLAVSSLLLGSGAAVAQPTDGAYVKQYFLAQTQAQVQTKQQRVVPDVRGMPLAFAKAEVDAAGFNLKESRVFWKDAVVGEQNPKAGERHHFDGWIAVAPKAATPAPSPAQTPPIAADADDTATQVPNVAPPKSPASPAPMPAPMPVVPPVEKIEKSVMVPEPKAFGNHTKRGILPDDLPDGLYLLRVAGVVKTLESAEEIVLNGPGPGPAPIPDVPPVPPLSDRYKEIKAAAEKATGDAKRAETAAGLIAVYKEIAASCKAPATLANATNFTLTFTDTVVSHQGQAAVTAWAPVRALVRAHIVDMIQTGKSVEDFGSYLTDELAAAIQSTIPAQAEGITAYKAPAGHSISGISPEFWTFLLELLKMILPLLLPKATVGMVPAVVLMAA